MRIFMKALAIGVALSLAAAPALAHSTVKSTEPRSGSILQQSPPEIVITFNEPARLTSVILAEAGMAERKLDFTPGGSATTFKLPAPKLGSGRNEIKWKALSKDGHPISGSIIIVIRSGPAQPDGAADGAEDTHSGH